MMTEQPETGAEAIVVPDDEMSVAIATFEKYDNLDDLSEIMRHVLAATAAFRHAQPTSGLADDARKVAKSLEHLLARFMRVAEDAYFGYTFPEEVNAAATLPLAESLPGKIEALERERGRALADKEMTEKLLGGSLYSARMALQSRAEAAEAQLAACDAEVARLREALERIKRTIGKARNRASAALTAYDIASDILAALAPIPEKMPPGEPTEHEAFGAMIHRGKQEARNNGGEDE